MKLLPARFSSRLVAAFCISFLTAFSFSAADQDPFEGRIKMKMSDGSDEQSIDYLVKGERMRIEPEDPRAQGGVMIMNMAKKEVYMLMPEQKMYMTMPIPDMSAEEENRKPEPTGKSRTILGYEAKEYTVEHDGDRFEIWATDELGSFGALQIPGDGPQGTSALSGAIGDEAFFPLLIVGRSGEGETLRIEVTEVEKKELENSLFEVPSDYRGMSIPMGMPQ